MKLLSLLILNLCVAQSVYADDERSWMVSGDELLYNLRANESNQNLTSSSSLLNSQAQGYIVAVMDSRDWCMKGQVLPHDVYDRVHSYLNSLDKDALSINASELVNNALETYCKS
jgi:hypothetical protein